LLLQSVLIENDVVLLLSYLQLRVISDRGLFLHSLLRQHCIGIFWSESFGSRGIK